ncbi:hypothetical protein K504DRAFT_279989 [Pleomassaria siparia CBS 279.74]|uniref:Uncharacterized protein n=1 Tax=Pleomassaria siparia CBS 279.74 TaxID=1314801 RepID=A0A6G1KA41_9PLEO|nr:hypothetical protein K504DRAFT_279989 [Pleomassaria siparia CBS 279.74]
MRSDSRPLSLHISLSYHVLWHGMHQDPPRPRFISFFPLWLVSQLASYMHFLILSSYGYRAGSSLYVFGFRF